MRIGDNGVTLIELLVVLAVLSISLGIAGTAVTDWPVKRLSAACSELQADLRYAQRRAVAENRKYEVNFSKTKNGYLVLRREGGLITTTIKDKTFDGDITLVGTTAVDSSVVYTTRGTTGDACTITLKNSKYKVDLTVNLGSGRIEQKKFVKLNTD